MQQLSHVALGTGIIRSSSRSDIDPAAIALGRTLIARAAEGGSAPMPWPYDDCVIELQPVDGGFKATLSAADDLASVRRPVCAVAISAPEGGTVELWDRLIALRATVSTTDDVVERPDGPWCAHLILPAAELIDRPIEWVDEFIEALAWAWQELASERV